MYCSVPQMRKDPYAVELVVVLERALNICLCLLGCVKLRLVAASGMCIYTLR